MTDDILLPFSFPAVERKKVTAAFDGGRISSDGGVILLAQAERRLGVAKRLAAVIPDGRNQSRVTHLLADILRARILAIAWGYEDADDLDRLRLDPAFKLACGRLLDLCSQPTVSRWENVPSLRDLARLMGVMVISTARAISRHPPDSQACGRVIAVTIGYGGLPGKEIQARSACRWQDVPIAGAAALAAEPRPPPRGAEPPFGRRTLPDLGELFHAALATFCRTQRNSHNT